MAGYSPDKALDDDPDTHLTADYGIHQAMLGVDLGAETTVSRAFIS